MAQMMIKQTQTMLDESLNKEQRLQWKEFTCAWLALQPGSPVPGLQLLAGHLARRHVELQPGGHLRRQERTLESRLETVHTAMKL